MQGEVVLITGCSTGIGRATAATLATAGYEVVATARRPEELEGIGAAMALQLDVTDTTSIEATVSAVLERHGWIDVLVNNERYQGVTAGMRRQEPEPEAVSRVVRQAIESARPRAHYVAGLPFPGRLVLHLGDFAWDLVVRKMFRI